MIPGRPPGHRRAWRPPPDRVLAWLRRRFSGLLPTRDTPNGQSFHPTHPGAPWAWAVLGAIVASLPGASCQTVAGYEDFERAAQTRSHPCDVLDRQKEGSRGQLVVLVESSGTECFWVDETEVTVREYETWLDEPRESAFDAWDTTFCSWKSPGPSDPSRNVDDECRQSIAANESDPFGAQKPIRCVDWCDAHAFCESTGSQLCHHNNTGGSLEPEGFASEWQKACDGRLDPDLYPWGDEPAPSEVCNINQTEMDCQATGTLSCGPTPVGQLEDCATPNGMKDPLGNVAEWVFACAKGGSGEPDGTCLAFGGGYADSRASCSSVGQVGRIKQDRFPDVGFRCCEALTTEERVRVY